MSQISNERVVDLFNDIKNFNIISDVEFFQVAMNVTDFDTFENDLTISADTGNLDAINNILHEYRC